MIQATACAGESFVTLTIAVPIALFHKLHHCLALSLASVEGIRDLGHDLAVGDPAIRSDGRNEVGGVGVTGEGEDDRRGTCEVASDLLLLRPFDASLPFWSEGFGASDGEAVGLSVSRPWRVAKSVLVNL